MAEVRQFKVLSLPLRGVPDSIYYVKTGPNTAEQHITDSFGNYVQVGGGSGTTITSNNKTLSKVILGESVSGGTVVYLTNVAFKYNQNNTNLYGLITGITNSSGLNGEEISIVTSGECDQLGGLVPGLQYYAGSNGAVQALVPLIGIVQPVGIAISTTKLIVNLQKPYIRI